MVPDKPLLDSIVTEFRILVEEYYRGGFGFSGAGLELAPLRSTSQSLEISLYLDCAFETNDPLPKHLPSSLASKRNMDAVKRTATTTGLNVFNLFLRNIR